jgi:hypothetical protein
MAREFRVFIENVDPRATRQVTATDEKGEPITVEQPSCTFALRLEITDDALPEPFVERITAEQAWQLSGVYGDTRAIIDLTAAQQVALCKAWASNAQKALVAALADPDYRAKVAKVLTLKTRLAGGLVLSGVA